MLTARRLRTINNTREFITALLDYVNKTITCFYEESPENGSFPYGVINGLHITDIESGDSVNFILDIYADEKQDGATVALEDLTDTLRAHFTNAVINKAGIFNAHIGFDSQKSVNETEFDLCHRRLTLTARIFYL